MASKVDQDLRPFTVLSQTSPACRGPDPLAHNGAVTAPSFVPVVATSLLRIDAADAAPLSAAQQLFNSWVERIAAQRATLQAWEAAVQACRSRYARDGLPLRTQYLDLQAELAHTLDLASARKLSKQEQQWLAEQVCESAQQVADCTDTPAQQAAMQELLRRYGPQEARDALNASDHDVEGEAAAAGASAAPTAQTVPDEALVDWDDPDAVAQYVEAQAQAAADQAERARAQHQAQRQQRKKVQAAKAKGPTAAELATQSLREVYRRLASRLHPDREPDEAARARKTVLMQRVNQAYETGRLMELLELQWEAEQLDPARLAQLPDARLAPYNRMLELQYQDLQRALDAQRQAFAREFGLPAHSRLQPNKLMAQVRERLQQLQAGVDYLRQLLRALQEDPDVLRVWLKQSHTLARQRGD